MEPYRLTVDPAFRLLARASHTTNRKLRDIAEELTSPAPCRSDRLQQTRPAAAGDAVHLSHAVVHPVSVEGSRCSLAAVLRMDRREAADR
jgi:ANTAR domain